MRIILPNFSPIILTVSTFVVNFHYKIMINWYIIESHKMFYMILSKLAILTSNTFIRCQYVQIVRHRWSHVSFTNDVMNLPEDKELLTRGHIYHNLCTSCMYAVVGNSVLYMQAAQLSGCQVLSVSLNTEIAILFTSYVFKIFTYITRVICIENISQLL